MPALYPVKQFPGFVFDDYRELGAMAAQYNYKNKWISHNLLGNYSKLMGRHDVRVRWRISSDRSEFYRP